MYHPQPVRTIVIPNISEFYRPLYRDANQRQREAWTEPSRAESDMALFWRDDDKLVIMPHRVPQEFLDDVRRALHYRNVQVVSPANSGDSICEDILADTALFTLLVETLRCSPAPQIITWGATEQLYILADALRREGVAFDMPEVPARDNFWAVRYLGSKSGFRDFCIRLSQTEADVRIPPGFICSDVEMASEVAEWFVLRGKGFVVKPNESVSGYGTLMYGPEKARQLRDLKALIHMQARLTPVLSVGPVVVEEYIESQVHAAIRSPSIQVVVDQAGHARVRCLACQLVRPDGKYLGAVITPNLLPAVTTMRLRRIGMTVGQAVSTLGYRGVFNIDTVVGVDEQVYCVELNARRTSVTYTLDIAEHLVGVDFSQSMSLVTCERFPVQKGVKYTYRDVRARLSRLLFPIGDDLRGIIITIPSSLLYFVGRPQLGFISLARNMRTALSIFIEACELLGGDPNEILAVSGLSPLSLP